MGMLVIVGALSLIVARETNQMDAFEIGLLGIVAVLCLGYSGWVFIEWAVRKSRPRSNR